MKTTFKAIVIAALTCIHALALPITAQAGQDAHQRYLIQKALQAKHEAKKEQAKQNKECDEAANTTDKDKQTSN